MVGKGVPRNGQVVTSVLGVKETVVEVLVVGIGVGERAVVDPDVGRGVNVNQIAALDGLVEVEVADNDVGSLLDADAAVGETYLY